MRPNRIKSKKNINRKIPKKKYLRKKKYFWGSTGIQTADLDSINLVLYRNKKKVAKENLGCSWNVVPKDSCEIYKKRYQRQKESGRDYNNRTDNTDDSEESRDVERMKQNSSRNIKKRCKCRQRRCSSFSKYSKQSTASETSIETSMNSSESEATR